MNEKMKKLYNITDDWYDIKIIRRNKLLLSFVLIIFTCLCAANALFFIHLWKTGYIVVFAKNLTGHKLPYIGFISKNLLPEIAVKYAQTTEISILYSCIPLLAIFYLIIAVFIRDSIMKYNKIILKHEELIERQQLKKENDYLSRKNQLDDSHSQAPIVYTENDISH